MDTVEYLRFQDLSQLPPGLSQLYLDYLYDFEKVSEFFEVGFQNKAAYPDYAKFVCRKYQHRQDVVTILFDQNQTFGASEQTLEHIRWLQDENSVAIVTGQQVGILGGPLYTYYKTLTALKLAAHLNATQQGRRFVPVFWLEGEDHDFAEVSNISVLNQDHQPTTIEYFIGGKPTDKNFGSVGQLAFDTHIGTFFEQLVSALPSTEFRSTIIDLYRSLYAEGTTFTVAFARLLNRLFEGRGLVFIDPSDVRLKKLIGPVFRTELSEVPHISQVIIDQSAVLEERYHAQIKPKAINLFMSHKGGRYLIEPRENDFSLKGTRQHFDKEALLRKVEETPELFSPNVALRPVCQDILLPTLCYVAGPSEIAYFAQLKPVYDHFNVPMPIIYPRATVTLIEQRHEKTLAKYGLEISDVFDAPQHISRRVIETVDEVKLDDMFDDIKKRITDILQELKFGLISIDPTLEAVLEHTSTKMLQTADQLKSKATVAQQQRHEIALRQIARMANSIFPGGNLQERQLCLATFLNKYGFGLLSRMYQDISVDVVDHQCLWIGKD